LFGSCPKVMSIEHSGEFKRERGAVESEQDVNGRLFGMYSGMRIQNNHPIPGEQPADVFYWKDSRLETVRHGLGETKALAGENHISEIVNPVDPAERVSLAEFVVKVQRSIVYSEQVAAQLKGRPVLTEEESRNKRQAMKRRLLGEE
jgi:hypothetical protein